MGDAAPVVREVGVEVREGTKPDILAIMPMVRAYYAHTWVAKFSPWDFERIGRLVLEHVSDEDKVLLLCFESGSPIPIGFLTAVNIQSFWNEAVSMAHETAMWVAPESKGKGAGTALFSAYQDWAQGQGCDVIVTAAAQSMSPKMTGRLYRKFGFDPVERVYVRGVE